MRSLEQTLGETATAAQDLKQQLLKEKVECPGGGGEGGEGEGERYV